MKKILLSLAVMASAIAVEAKTLVVYYSYTNNVHNIVTELTKQIDADVVRIEPAEKGLDYAANNYAIIPDGDFLSPSLWIRSAQTSTAASMISDWLKAIGYEKATVLEDIQTDRSEGCYTIFSMSGTLLAKNALSYGDLDSGVYIINGKKMQIK